MLCGRSPPCKQAATLRARAQGRQFPVQVFYTAAPEESYLDAALSTVMQARAPALVHSPRSLPGCGLPSWRIRPRQLSHALHESARCISAPLPACRPRACA